MLISKVRGGELGCLWTLGGLRPGLVALGGVQTANSTQGGDSPKVGKGQGSSV